MYQRPDGLFEKKITISGKRHAFRGMTEREVMQKTANFTQRAEQGAAFGEMADEWWEYKKPRLSPNTVNGYKTAMRRAVERFGELSVKNITAMQTRTRLCLVSKSL